MPRWLESLTIRGFKSYAHEQTLPFARGLNVIHGPNGCGKSNVIDALLFVFGEEPGKLRVAQLAELRSSSTEAVGSQPCVVSAVIRDLGASTCERHVLSAELKADRCEHRCGLQRSGRRFRRLIAALRAADPASERFASLRP
jgi:chromosome segregation ATPase